MRKFFSSVQILFIAFVGFGLMLLFSYLFLFNEDLSAYNNNGSIEDHDDSLIQQILFDHHNHKYGEYLLLKQHCNKTLSQASPKFTKLVLIIIDALRIDFLPSIKNSDYSTPRMPYLEQITKIHGILFIYCLLFIFTFYLIYLKVLAYKA